MSARAKARRAKARQQAGSRTAPVDGSFALTWAAWRVNPADTIKPPSPPAPEPYRRDAKRRKRRAMWAESNRDRPVNTPFVWRDGELVQDGIPCRPPRLAWSAWLKASKPMSWVAIKTNDGVKSFQANRQERRALASPAGTPADKITIIRRRS